MEEELPLLPGMKYLSPGPLDISSSSVSSCFTGGDSVRAMPSSYLFSGSMMDHLPNSIVPHLHTVKQATSSAGSVVPNEAWEGAARWTLPVSLNVCMFVIVYQGIVNIIIALRSLVFTKVQAVAEVFLVPIHVR